MEIWGFSVGLGRVFEIGDIWGFCVGLGRVFEIVGYCQVLLVNPPLR